MPKRWHIRPHDSAAVAALERTTGVSSIVAALLVARGITDPAAVKSILTGSLADLRDPETLPGVPEAADRILAAARAGKKVVIYGDYDADGMCATAILAICLGAIDATPEWYVPCRHEEGYGLNTEALDTLAARGAQLVITVDCGITGAAEARHARSLGLELVITDHHTFGDTLPEADAVVHPRLPGGGYPFGDLCGAAVAFKLAWAIATRASGSNRVTPRLREALLRGIGLAAFGTITDVMPLVDENRLLVKHGLEQVRLRGGPGLARMIELAGLVEQPRLGSEDVAFKLGPRLNAAGRMATAANGIELLVTDDPTRGAALADYLDELSKQRGTEERSLVLAATKQAKELFDPEADAALVLADRGWHKGVIGIAAGRLADRWHRPVILFARDALQGGPATGSARSVPGFDVLAAIKACEEHLLGFGGHAAAAGLQIDDMKIDDFRRAFVAAVEATLPDELRRGHLSVDGETSLGGITLHSVEQLEQLAPFGEGNRRPLFCASGVTLAEPAKAMGATRQHIQMRLRHHAAQIRGVAFGGAEWLPHLPPPGQPFHIAFRPTINAYGGRRMPEIHVVDWRPDGIDVARDLPASAAATA